MRLLDWPLPEKITHFTPSSYETFRKCALQGVLSRSPQYKEFIYLNPKTLIGSVCHRIIESLGRGNFDDVQEGKLAEEIDKQYDELCSDLFVKSKNSIYPTQYSSPQKWPGYYMRLARLKVITHKLYQARKSNRSVIRTSGQFIEKQIEVFGGKLKGRPDRVVFVSSNEILIEDYKSGVIFDDESRILISIKQQMLFYSAILHKAFPEKRLRFRIVPFKGQPYEEIVDIKQANALAEKVVELLNEVNSIITGIESSSRSFHDLANPEIQNCRICSFKFRCNRYFDHSFPESELVSIRGNFIDFEQNTITLSVTTTTINQIVKIRHLSEPKYVFLRTLIVGTFVIFTEVKRVVSQGNILLFEPTIRTIALYE
ncbi:PD-(D/E)XK nuclease family protein [Paenibacillus alkalitolerans]|uniref:PD-(D/E)XK nuclease family protein n=1 Tax=Paenibacillus alkalitolerans TaxID=2799335 RepID=UPI0018F488A1|nr:PD-(D/E)XK nuclease family protein [Paenibacillus alkalitolerans]